MDIDKQQLVQRQFAELHKHYDELVFEKWKDDTWSIKGKLKISASYNGTVIRDNFDIEILIPSDYPESVPLAKETGGQIPAEFHTNHDQSLCIGAPLHIKMKFMEAPTLLWFVEGLLVPFLFSFSYHQKTGEMPFGELAHGLRGILDSYKELFGVESDIQTIKLLRIIAEGKYKGHLECPCGSGKRIRYCHGPQIIDVSKYQTEAVFFEEYWLCILEYIKGGNELPVSLRSKKLVKKLVKFLDVKHIDYFFGRRNNRKINKGNE